MRNHIIPYNPKLKARSRQLRSNMTKGEVILWQRLRNKQMMGYAFHRQRPIDQFIVDFYCKPLALAIEVDGSIHNDEAVKERDEERQLKLEALGVRFLRFSDDDVQHNTNAVCDAIATWIKNNHDQPPQTP
ncbi:MAG: endonuclease domain-containing protein [Cyanobacteria bacterium J06598_3]